MTWAPIHVWAVPEYADHEMSMTITADSLFAPPLDRDYVLELLYVPAGITDAPPIGTHWVVPPDRALTVTVPAFRDKDGDGGYQFAFTVGPVVPEPSAIALVAAGFCMTARGRRRRPA
jgi:hypothetical protein